MDDLITGRADGEQIARNMAREAKAHALIEAVLDCDRDDRLPFLEAILEGMRAGMPIAPFGTIMAEANFWSELASRAELKAYCAASFARLSPDDQAAFLSFARQRAAA